MTRKLLVLAALSFALSPAAALAGRTSDTVASNASKHCTTLRAKIGVSSFAQAFTSFGACVTRLRPLELKNSSTAATSCRSERADVDFAATHGGKTFARFYGRGAAAKNSFGNCVSRKAQASSAAERASATAPSRTCTSLQSSLGSSDFAKTYGTNGSSGDAFGSCVSTTARAQIAAELAAAATCTLEPANRSFGSTHDGMSFGRYYGTNADLSNAFGKCVTLKAQVAVAAVQQQQAANPAAGCGSAAGAGGNASSQTGVNGRRPPLPMSSGCAP